MFYQDVIHNVHTNSETSSYRSIYMDCTALFKHWDGMQDIYISLTASPEFRGKNNVVGYRTFTDADIGAIILPKHMISQIFVPNRTLLVRITLRREQGESLFKFKSL